MMHMNLVSIYRNLLVLLCLGLSACSMTSSGDGASQQDLGKIDAQTNVVYYRCGGLTMNIQFHGEEALLNWKGKEYPLTQAVSASGVHYLGEGASFWSEGNEAAVEIGDLSHFQCQLVRVES